MGRLFWQVVFTLLLATLLGCGGPRAPREADFERAAAAPAPADLVLRNGKIITVDRDFSIKQALAIRDGRFVAVGEDRDVRVLIGRGTRVIELAGRTVIPGLIDAHIHATEAGLAWDAELHWERLRLLSDGLRQITAAVKTKPPGSWIVVGGGWVPTQFAEKRFPSRAELDAIAPNHPVYVQYLREAALLNSAGLKTLGMTPATPDPAGGRLERNPKTGELSGWLQGTAWESAYKKIAHRSLDQARQSLQNCFRELNRLGVTSVADFQSAEVNFAHRRLLAEMARGGNLTVRMNIYVELADDAWEEQLKRLAEEMKRFPKSDLFRFAGFGERLARRREGGNPPLDAKGFYIAAETKAKFRALARHLGENNHGLQVQTPDDAAAQALLDLLEEIHAGAALSARRIAVAHLDDPSPQTLAKLNKLGGGITVQDPLALTGERKVETWGMEKARNAPPLRTMLQSGIPVGAGTDAFVAANYSPMLSLWWLVTGKTVAGSSIRSKSENLTREEALRLYTMGSAWFTFEEGRKGSIEVGKLADLAVLNGDYLTVSEDRIRSLESLLTIVGGKIVYFAPPFTADDRRPAKGTAK